MNKRLKEKIEEALSSVVPITAIVLLLSISIAPLTPGALILFLFGAVLLRLAETEKALIYLSVAAHQNPDCLKYIRALNEAQGIRGGAMRRFARFARRG